MTSGLAAPINFVSPKSISLCYELPAPDKTLQARAGDAISFGVFDIDFHNNISRRRNFAGNYVTQTLTPRRIFS